MFDEKKTVSYIKSGYVKRYHISKQGVIAVQSTYGPNIIFSLTATLDALLDTHTYLGDEQYHYEVVSPTEIYTLRIDALKAAAEANPLIYKEILSQTGKRIQSAIQYLENMALKDPYSRIAHILVYYAYRFGEKTEQGQRISIPLRQQDLADIMNLTRETVTRSMVKLRSKGLLAPGSVLVIPDMEALKAVYQ